MGYYAGIDVGSVTTKAVITTASAKVVGSAVVPTGVSGKAAAERALEEALLEARTERGSITRLTATGYGRDLVTFADAKITEITCHGRGAFEKAKSAFTLIDIGGQDTKAIAVNNVGKVETFVMNDRCAAGTGRFLEVMARVLETDLENMSTMALAAPRRTAINNMCTVFAETEVVSMLASGTPRDEISKGLCWGVAERVGAMAKKVGLSGTVFVSGGVAYNRAVIFALAEYLPTDVVVLEEPQINGAFGAALAAAEKGI